MILDTDILIDLDKSHPPALSWFISLTELPRVAGFAAMELKQGCLNLTQLRNVNTFLSPFDIVWPSIDEMNHAMVAFGALRLSHGVGLLDSLIAATAIGNGVPLATFNVKHFSVIPGLTIVQPYKR